MTDPFSPTHRNGRKFTRRRERQMAFLKALGETGSGDPCRGHRRCRPHHALYGTQHAPRLRVVPESVHKRVSWRPTSHGAASAEPL